jgi:hypothetical protein
LEPFSFPEIESLQHPIIKFQNFGNQSYWKWKTKKKKKKIYLWKRVGGERVWKRRFFWERKQKRWGRRT